MLKPDYIHGRIKELQKSFRLRLLLCHVDVEDVVEPLGQVIRAALLNEITLICAWSPEVLPPFRPGRGQCFSSKASPLRPRGPQRCPCEEWGSVGTHSESVFCPSSSAVFVHLGQPASQLSLSLRTIF